MSMTSKEVMSLLGISAANLYQYRKRNKLKYRVDENGKYVYDEDSVYALVQSSGRGKRIVAYDRMNVKGVSVINRQRMVAVRSLAFSKFGRKKGIPEIETLLEEYEAPNTTIFLPKFENIFTNDISKEMNIGTLILMYKDSITPNKEDMEVIEKLLKQKGVRLLYVHDFCLGDRVTDLDAECIIDQAPWHLIEQGIFNYEKMDSRYYIPRKELDEFLVKKSKDLKSVIYLCNGIPCRNISNRRCENSDALTHQLKIVRDFCRKYYLPIDEIYIDGINEGILFQKKNFRKMLEDIKSNIVKNVYALNPDVISYNEKDVENFLSIAKQTKTAVHFVEEDAKPDFKVYNGREKMIHPISDIDYLKNKDKEEKKAVVLTNGFYYTDDEIAYMTEYWSE